MPQPIADQIRSLPMSPNLGSSLERALGFAREQSHRAVTLEHLLLAFTEDPDASVVLQASNMDLLRLGTDVSGYLGRLPEEMRSAGETEPSADPELVRVLQAAVQAAQQSRRRQIDGAIVLAAIVGDGKSPAAGLLKTHGLTFEDAIRALQKTTAKGPSRAATGQPAASPSVGMGTAPSPDRPMRPAPPAQVPERQAQRTEAPPPPSPATNDVAHAAVQASAAPPPPVNGRAPAEAGQSVEEILAAARARIEQRSAAMTGNTVTRTEAPQAPSPPRERTSPPSPPVAERARPPGAEPPPPSATPSPPPQEPSAPPRSPTGQAPAARPSWTPPAGGPIPSRAQPEKAASATSQRQPASPPFPQASLAPGEGPTRPPLPGRVSSSLPPQRPSSEPQAPQRPSANGARPNGAAAEPHPMPPGPGRTAQRAAGQPAQGPLVETIPRRMRAGETSVAQVRISRDRVDGLIQLLMRGRGGVQRPEALLSRALTVRLRAPDGGFWIEALSPETQWAETAAGPSQDEHLTWRWNVTPRDRGRARLLLLVGIRTTGRDGIMAETSPPERAIEITTGGGRFSGLGRWMGFLLVLLLGAVLGRFGEEVWAIGSAILKRITG